MLPQKIKRKIIYKSKLINFYTDKVIMPSGKTIEKYHFLDYQKKSVVVLLTNQKKEICFIKAPRYTTQKVEWELPAGIVENHETILQAAKREALEETGFTVKALQHIYTFNPDTCLSNQIVYVVSGVITRNKQKKFDTDEVTAVHWLSMKQIKKMISNNKINDGCSLIPLLLYLNKTITHG